MNSRLLLALGAVVLVSAAGLFGANRLGLFDGGPVVLSMVENCSLHLEPCSIEFPQGGRMTLDISPRQPSPSDALRVVASFEGVDPESVGIRFKGVNMNMGYLEKFVFELQRSDASDGAVSFSGQAGVFACSVNRMQWQALVRVQLGSTGYEVPFAFETQQRDR